MIVGILATVFVVLQGLSWDPYTDDSADVLRVYYDPGGLAHWRPLAEISPAIGEYETYVEVPLDVQGTCATLPVAFMVRAVNTSQSPEVVSPHSNVADEMWTLVAGSTLRDFASCAGIDICPPCVQPEETCPDGCSCDPCP